jgi:hypothetical protein
MASPLYRTRQALRALTAFLRPPDYETVGAVLSPELTALFRRMRRSEQHHSLQVMRTLREAGHDHPDLLTAALLHDVGKSRCPFSFFDRVWVVLAAATVPERAKRWGEGEARGFRRPFVIRAKHPAWSAEDIAAAGGSALACALARRHQDRLETISGQEDRLLALLQAADDEA